ncbi:MAG: AAA family ATPase, partial [Methanocorpusculum sp.]|nr:AAA family ATPase [Methanocorpusculum sp.]
MERLINSELQKWKNSKTRKPLILRGVRQCGKTWILKEFGRQNFEDVAYFSFENNAPLFSCFETD